MSRTTNHLLSYFFLILLIYSGQSFAKKSSFYDVVVDSNSISRVLILSGDLITKDNVGEKYGCGMLYGVKSISLLKAIDKSNHPKMFYSNQPFKVGREYLVFLSGTSELDEVDVKNSCNKEQSSIPELLAHFEIRGATPIISAKNTDRLSLVYEDMSLEIPSEIPTWLMRYELCEDDHTTDGSCDLYRLETRINWKDMEDFIKNM